jgi:P-type Ca2+ transporter type 2C
MRRAIPMERLTGLIDDQRGLTGVEVDERRGRYGLNRIVEAPSFGWGQVIRDTAQDPMIWFLVGTAALFTLLGDYTEAIVLALALVPIAGMDAYLFRRTQASTAGLSGRLASRARVVRDGAVREIPAAEIVPGDLVIVPEGQPFPADGIIVRGEGLQFDESALTGESFPMRKRALPRGEPAGAQLLPVDDIYWGVAGTRLLTGEAGLRIAYIGAETLYGQIVRSVQQGRQERTPLQQAIANLVTRLVIGAAIMCLALAITRYAQGYGALDAFLSAVTLAIAALPEEFPVVFTFFLGVGVYRLGRRQALVRRAVVVENIGRVTCICSDKTGTLTEGRLSLAHSLPAPGVTVARLVGVAATASRAEGADPLDLALFAHGAALEGNRLETFPFTEDRRREVAIIREPSGAILAAAKGAPENLLQMTNLSEAERQAWRRRTGELAAAGHKVIACAEHPLLSWQGGEPDRGYRFLGLLAFEDPPRDGVADAVARARGAGIRVIMVTGDHPATARAIAVALGIGAETPEIIEGSELGQRLAAEGGEALRSIDVVARAVPAQKLDLVRALQRAGEIVAVTGDGVNDAPALQGADIGIAMGERGTRTAREVASIVLLDDNFRTIVGAIAEGRQLFHNLKLSFAYLLMVHLPLVATAAIIPFAGYPLLFLPVHVVWLELIMHPTALLVFQQPADPDRLDAVERARRLRFFAGWEWSIIALVSSVIAIVVLLGYGRSLGSLGDVEHARTMALIALVVASATVTLGLAGLGSKPAIIAIVATIVSAIMLVQVEPVARLVHLRPLHLDDWLLAALGGAAAGILSSLFPRLALRSRQRR